jgi:hypothetical protein
MYTGLMIIGGIFWSLTYILIIRRGFKDKTYGMPLAALCANISWEAIFSFIHPLSPPQLYINYIWFFLDLIIVLQFLNFGKTKFLKFSIRQFYSAFLMALTTAFFLVLFITYEFNGFKGAYTAFGQDFNLIISFCCLICPSADCT